MMGLHDEVCILGLTMMASFILWLRVQDEVYIIGLTTLMAVILTAIFKWSSSIKTYIWPQEERGKMKDQSPLIKLLTPQYSPVSELIIGHLDIHDVVAASQAYKPWSNEVWRMSQLKIDQLEDIDSNLLYCSDDHTHKVTPLQKAIMLGDKIATQELIRRGANLNARVDQGKFIDEDDEEFNVCLHEGFTLAHLCSLVNDVDTARLLLKEGCNFDDSASGFTPLQEAVFNKDRSLEFVKFLVEEAKVDIDARTEDGLTATEIAFDRDQDALFPTASGLRGVFYYLRSRGGATTWEFLRDWMKLEKCSTLM